jgi:type I restriction enzyme S subunit
VSAALADFCTFSGGGKLKLSKQHYVSEGFPAFSAAGQDGYVAIAEFHAPAIVVSAIGARCGKAFLAEGAWTSLANTYCVFPDISKAHPRFVWYQLNDENSWKKSGSAQPFIKPSDIKQRRIALPPLEEQRRIVGLLDRAAEIRRRADAARAKARAIIPALFLDMFGDPATNPKGWPVRSLGKLGELDRGRSRHRPRNAPELYGGEHPFIQTGDVANSEGHILSYQQTYSDLGLAQSRLWPAGTLCITIAANIGKTGILDFEACFPDSVVGFTPASEVTSEFVMLVLNFMQAEIEARAPQAAQKNINLQVLRGLEVPVPPLPLQTAFAEQAQRLEATARALDTAAAKAEAMAASLSAKVFTASDDGNAAYG